jgi:hypothetical protein
VGFRNQTLTPKHQLASIVTTTNRVPFHLEARPHARHSYERFNFSAASSMALALLRFSALPKIPVDGRVPTILYAQTNQFPQQPVDKLGQGQPQQRPVGAVSTTISPRNRSLSNTFHGVPPVHPNRAEGLLSRPSNRGVPNLENLTWYTQGTDNRSISKAGHAKRKSSRQRPPHMLTIDPGVRGSIMVMGLSLAFFGTSSASPRVCLFWMYCIVMMRYDKMRSV